MPGLVGLVTRMPPAAAHARLKRMVRAMQHESFYVSGEWSDESIGLYFGWVLRPETVRGPMPASREGGNLALVVSGECFADPEDGTLPSAKQHPLPTQWETLSGFADTQPFFAARLDGIFQGILIDRSRNTAALFNDRYGLHRIYYHQNEDAFYFAAEAKAIHAVCPQTRAITDQGLGELITLGCVLENRSPFHGIYLAPPASKWSFVNGTVDERTTYFQSKGWEDQERLDDAAYYKQVQLTIERNFPQYFQGGGRCGIALTGGLDTRVLLAMSGSETGPIPCYTFGGSLRESNDVRIARLVARKCGHSHQVIGVGEQFLSNFSHYAERTCYLTDGAATVANSPDLFLSERVRQIAPVKVVGTWGSELLRQAVTFKPSTLPHGLFEPEILAQVQLAKEEYKACRRAHPVTFAAFQQTPWAQYGVEALEQTQLTIRAPFLSHELVRTIYQAPHLATADVRTRLIRDRAPHLATIPSDRGVRADAQSALGSLARLCQELTFKCEYGFDTGMPQWLARASSVAPMSSLEKAFLGRHKFIHFRKWYSEALAPYVKQILLDRQTQSRPYLRRTTLEAIVKSHTEGTRNHTTAIHCLLSLELLERHLRRSWS